MIFAIIGGGALVLLGLITVVVVLLLKRTKQKVSTVSSHVANLTSDLKNEKEKSDIIINSIEDGVMLLDKDRVIRLFNPAASTISGWPADEAVGIGYQNVLKFINERSEPLSSDSHPIEKGFVNVTPFRDNNANLLSRAGKTVPLSISISPLMDKNGNLEGAVAVFRDVTNERNEEKQRAEFISTASHEMRTPTKEDEAAKGNASPEWQLTKYRAVAPHQRDDQRR